MAGLGPYRPIEMNGAVFRVESRVQSRLRLASSLTPGCEGETHDSIALDSKLYVENPSRVGKYRLVTLRAASFSTPS